MFHESSKITDQLFLTIHETFFFGYKLELVQKECESFKMSRVEKVCSPIMNLVIMVTTKFCVYGQFGAIDGGKNKAAALNEGYPHRHSLKTDRWVAARGINRPSKLFNSSVKNRPPYPNVYPYCRKEMFFTAIIPAIIL